LVLVDSLSGYTGATAVTRKGPEPFAVRAGSTFLKELGYPRMVLQTDGEPAIRGWAAAVQREWSTEGKEIQTQSMTRASPAGSHQSMGMAENTVRRVEGIVKTIKVTLERILKMTIMPRSSREWCGTARSC
jgi:hypothetical protein